MGPWRTSVYQVSHFSSNCPWSGFNLKCITVWGLWGPLPSLPPSFSFPPLLLALCEQGNNSSLAFPTPRERHRKGTAGNFLATLNLPGELHSSFPRQPGWRCTPGGMCVWRRGRCTHTVTLLEGTVYPQQTGRSQMNGSNTSLGSCVALCHECS